MEVEAYSQLICEPVSSQLRCELTISRLCREPLHRRRDTSARPVGPGHEDRPAVGKGNVHERQKTFTLGQRHI